MVSAANWFVSAGFCLVLLGIALRIITMMRASDAAHFSATPTVKHGRELISSHKLHFPGSALPVITVVTLAIGGAALVAGVAIHLTR